MTSLLRSAPLVVLLVLSCGDRREPMDVPAEKAPPTLSLPETMTVAEYGRKFPGPPSPHSFLIQKGTQRLRFYGMPHSRDPEDPAVVSLEKLWVRFVAATDGQDRVALVEGRVRRLGATREDALAGGGGEGGLLTFLASRDGVPIESPEPEWKDLFRAQEAIFDRATVCHAYYLRSLTLANQNGIPATIGETVDGGGPLAALGCDLDPVKLRSRHRVLFDAPLDDLVEDPAGLRAITDPSGKGPLSRVLANDAMLRDGAIVKSIHRRWREGRSIFALYGVAHARMQEPALRRALSPGSGL